MSREREYIEPDVKKVKIEGDEDIVFKASVVISSIKQRLGSNIRIFSYVVG